jgi:hypothetical protein
MEASKASIVTAFFHRGDASAAFVITTKEANQFFSPTV